MKHQSFILQALSLACILACCCRIAGPYSKGNVALLCIYPGQSVPRAQIKHCVQSSCGCRIFDGSIMICGKRWEALGPSPTLPYPAIVGLKVLRSWKPVVSGSLCTPAWQILSDSHRNQFALCHKGEDRQEPVQENGQASYVCRRISRLPEEGV